ncbi:MAG TPA: response regulator [Pseudoxanthomonas sp.]
MNALPSLLFVEDDPALRDLVGGVLQEMHFDVTLASDGQEAVAYLKTRAFDFIFSDIAMPHGMSGIDMAIDAAALQPGARIILTSGFAKAQLPPLPAGVAFLPKPYRITQLTGLLKELGGGSDAGVAREV